MPALQTITDALLVAAIESASRRVVMIAPGAWPPLAMSIASAWRRLGPAGVTVILDVDPEICRIGYGSMEGLMILQAAAATAGEAIGQEPGVRICVVIVDEETFVFSPTPRQLEAPPGSLPGNATPYAKANGIVLSKPPAAVERELGSGPEGRTARTLGKEPLNETKLKAVADDLKRNQPKSFDLSRAVNVYNSRIQFVEFHVSGYRVSQQTVTLPKHLINIARKNTGLAQKIESAVKLLDSGNPLVGGKNEGPAGDVYGPRNISQSTVEAARQAIEEKFLRSIKGAGKVIQRSQVEEFNVEVARLKDILVLFSNVLKSAIADQFRNAADEIADAILPDVLRALPEKWAKQLGPNPNPDHVRFRIIDELLHSFGDPEKRCQVLKASVVFKDVTYDMLKDHAFRTEITKYFPELPLMEEFTAAKERPASGKASLFN